MGQKAERDLEREKEGSFSKKRMWSVVDTMKESGSVRESKQGSSVSKGKEVKIT